MHKPANTPYGKSKWRTWLPLVPKPSKAPSLIGKDNAAGTSAAWLTPLVGDFENRRARELAIPGDWQKTDGMNGMRRGTMMSLSQASARFLQEQRLSGRLPSVPCQITPARGDQAEPAPSEPQSSRASRSPKRLLASAMASLISLSLLPGCSTVDTVIGSILGSSGPARGQPGYIAGFLGGVAADDPRAVLAGREVLSAGGNAADAAVAMGFTLTVTLPSRAGLGGGGACLAYAADPKSAGGGKPEAVLFTPLAPATPGANSDRPAAVPMMARGLFLLHARYGSTPFETLLSSAEQLARFGVPVSRALAKDIAAVSGPLLADPGASAIFSQNGIPLTEGQQLRQPDLGGALAQLRIAGVGDLYQGALAARIARVSKDVGGPIQLSDLRGALPKLGAPLERSYRNDNVAFLPPPTDGGLAAMAAFDNLAANPADTGGAVARYLAVIARYRAGGITPTQVLADKTLPAAGVEVFPASTSLVALDRSGNAVVCALTMDNLFGTGRIMPGLGILAAASPAAVPPPLLAAGLVWNDNIHAFRAAVGGSGQAGAPLAVAVGLINTLRTDRPLSSPVPDPGRANVIACSRYLPGENGACGWANDSREAGLAMGAN